MKLELGLIKIKDICFSDVSKVEDGVIYVNKEELINLLMEDENIKSVDFFHTSVYITILFQNKVFTSNPAAKIRDKLKK